MPFFRRISTLKFGAKRFLLWESERLKVRPKALIPNPIAWPPSSFSADLLRRENPLRDLRYIGADTA